jgi:hypothetical protein
MLVACIKQMGQVGEKHRPNLASTLCPCVDRYFGKIPVKKV